MILQVNAYIHLEHAYLMFFLCYSICYIILHIRLIYNFKLISPRHIKVLMH